MLRELECRKALPRESDYRLAGERGLFLWVKSSGHRSWHLGYWFHGKKLRMALGAYPEMSLADARAARDEARALIEQGTNPAVAKQQRKAARKLENAATFRVLSDAWLAERKPGWAERYATTVERMFENHLLPHWGTLPIGEITKPMVAQRLKAIEAQGLGETAHRAQQKLGEIFGYAEALGYELKNSGRVNAALSPVVQGRRPPLSSLGGCGRCCRRSSRRRPILSPGFARDSLR